MAVESTAPRNGLKTVLDTIVAPKEAFEAIRVAPTWGWALLIAILLSTIGTFLVIPAIQHAMASEWPSMVAKSPALSGMSADKQAQQLAVTQGIIGFSWLFAIIGVPIFVLFDAVVMLIFDKIGHGEGSFVKYFAAASNIAVPACLGTLLGGIIVTIRGASSFDSMASTQNVLPNLSLLAPGAGPKLAAFLSVFTPFTIWATVLAAVAILVIGRTGKVPAILAALVMMCVPALFAIIGK